MVFLSSPFLHNWRKVLLPLALVMGASSSAGYAASETLITKDDFAYKGAFRFPIGTYGASRMSWAMGTFAVAPQGGSVFVVGHANDLAVAEFKIPELSKSTNVQDLRIASAPVQSFSKIIPRAQHPSTDTFYNTITGLEYYQGKLIVNGIEYYDGDVNATDTTLVVSDASNIAGSTIHGFYKLRCKVRCSGWMSEVPSEWRSALGGPYITGWSDVFPINARNSIGPSAFIFDPLSLISKLSQSSPTPYIDSTEVLGYSVDNPLPDDINNKTLTNNLWTELSEARYGFIVPGTSTYVTIGSSGGHVSGIGYKLDNGMPCGGFCAIDPRDYYNYIWLWDVRDLLKVKEGRMNPYDVRPYWYGKFDVPFQNGRFGYNLIIAGDYDRDTNTLYLLLSGGDSIQSIYDPGHIMVAYEIAINRPNPPNNINVQVSN